MAWTYTLVYDGTAAGLRNQVRFRLGDTDTNRQLLQDEEIAYLLAEAADGVIRATIAAARAVLARFSTRPRMERVGEVTIDWGEVVDRMHALIAELSEELLALGEPWAGGVDVGERDDTRDDTSIVQPAFRYDQFTEDPAEGA